MAFGSGDLIEIDLRMRNEGQVMINSWQYEATVMPSTINAAQLGEAWWNHVKALYRATAFSTINPAFLSVIVRELNNASGEYGEYSIPLAEQAGTRSTAGAGEMQPPNLAIGVRLTVGTRVTKPGQKRFGFLAEGDQNAGIATAGITTVINNLMAVMDGDLLLGAPAATANLRPIVTKRDAQGFVVAHQPVIGYVVNGYVTTQNTRKIGRGI